MPKFSLTFDLVCAILYADKYGDFPLHAPQKRERKMKKLACFVAVMFALTVGCTSRMSMTYLQDSSVYGTGVVEISQWKREVVTLNPDGTVKNIVITSDTLRSAMTPAAADSKYKLAGLEAKVAIAQAKYSQPKTIDPCSGWNPPVDCRDSSYGYGSRQYRGERGSRAYRSSRGQGGGSPAVIYTGATSIIVGGGGK